MTKQGLGLVAAFAALRGCRSERVDAQTVTGAGILLCEYRTGSAFRDGYPISDWNDANATVAYDQYGQPFGSNSGTGEPSYVISSPAKACEQPESAPSYAAPRYVRAVRTEPAIYQEQDRQLAEPRYQRTRPTHRRRSVGKSVAIVGEAQV